MKENPYIGPRPYERGEGTYFYGRNREARDLLSLIMAERVVLFYAPSGAGKTSLLNAQIIPALEEEEFDVLPVVRLGGELPPDVDPQSVDNIFVFNTLMGLSDEDVDPPKLSEHTLFSFLAQYCPVEEDFDYRPPILIFDQFEEILTTHRDRWEDTRDFFEQLRQALSQMPTLGVVLSMREDYAATLDAYATLLPHRLRARFRMAPMDRDGALEAVRQPAEAAGRSFASGVAEQLVDNLRQIRGDTWFLPETKGLGPFVEPVQLQVVCRRLWTNLPDGTADVIHWEEIEEYGNIDQALRDFYEHALDQTIERAGVSERQLRAWFGQQLITPMGTRGLALQGPEQTAGLPNAAVEVLEQHRIIRPDIRAGNRWFELVHDRLVEPIMMSNQAWATQHQTSFTLAAQAWVAADKDPRRLFKGNQLEEIKAQAEAIGDDLTDVEREFLSASIETARIENLKRQRLALLGATALLFIMVALTGWALISARNATVAQQQAQIASTSAVASAGTAQAERDSAIIARAALAANLEANLTAQAGEVDAAGSHSPEATATIEAMQGQLSAVRATQTVVAQTEQEGVVISVGGAAGDDLLRDPYDEQSDLVWVPVDTSVTILDRGSGSPAYGSGEWYLVALVHPETGLLVQGWLPVEVVQVP